MNTFHQFIMHTFTNSTLSNLILAYLNVIKWVSQSINLLRNDEVCKFFGGRESGFDVVRPHFLSLHFLFFKRHFDPRSGEKPDFCVI